MTSATESEVRERVEQELEEERRTTYLELFFDLVFVFAITQVAALVLEDTSAAGFARSLLVLSLVWWAWSGFAWMTNAIDVDDQLTRVSMLVAMLATFFMALAIPGAFGADDVWFGCAYFSVAVLNVVLYLRGTRHDRELLRSVERLALFFLIAPSLVLAGGFAGGDVLIGLWVAGIAINLAGALDAGRSTWRVSAEHFAERHALFVIIALGESIVAVGLGALAAERGLPLAGAVLAALVGTCALWWAYFDFAATAIAAGLRRATDPVVRGRVARDVFTFAHFPMIAGIVLFAVAAKQAVAHGEEPLGAAGRFALGAGLALVFLSFAAGRFRLIHRIAWERIGAAGGVALVAWLGVDVSAAGLIAIAVGVVALALAVEAIRLRELRARVRAG